MPKNKPDTELEQEIVDLQALPDLTEVSWEEVEPDPDALEAASDADTIEPVQDKPKKKRGKAAKKAEIDPETGEPIVKPPRKTRAESRRFSPENIREMNRLFYTGMSKAKIAAQFECSAVFIWNVIQRNVYKDVDVSDIVAEFVDESATDDVPSQDQAAE